jgi:hypothetical protein
MATTEQQSRIWSMLCHLTALSVFLAVPFGNLLCPFIIWLVFKKDYPAVDREGRKSLNFQIAMTIYSLIAAVLCFMLIGFVLLPIVIVADIVLVIMATVKISNGEKFSYPFIFRLIKEADEA